MKTNFRLLTILLLSFFAISGSFAGEGDRDEFLLKKGDHIRDSLTLLNGDEPLYRLSNKYVVVLDYGLLREDFNSLKDKNDEEIDRIILDQLGYVAQTQVDLGTDTNDNIPHELKVILKGAVRQKDFGRALDLPFDNGYINVKGIGTQRPTQKGHKNGLMTLGEALREFTYSQIVRMVFDHAEVDYNVVRPYGVIYPGFSVKWGSDYVDPAGFLLRRAYSRQNGFNLKNSDLEKLLKEYNIILDGNIQNSYAGDVVDLGHAIMGKCKRGQNILLNGISNFNDLYGHAPKIFSYDRWGFSKLDYMWNEMHDIAKKFKVNPNDRELINNVINKYTRPIAHFLFPDGVRNPKIQGDIGSLTSLIYRKSLVGHRIDLKRKREIDRFFKLIELHEIKEIENKINEYKSNDFDIFKMVGKNSQTALHVAISSKSIDIVKLLVDNGAKKHINDTDIFGETPLHIAVTENYEDIVKYLLKNGANNSVNQTNYRRETPLYKAILSGSETIVQLLLENGANNSLNLAPFYGKNPLSDASAFGNDKIVKLLLDHGAKDFINEKDTFNRTPLYWATLNGREKVVELLIENGAGSSINLPNKDGETPLFIAASKGYFEIVKILLENGAKISSPENKVDIKAVFDWMDMLEANVGIKKIVQDINDQNDVNSNNRMGETPLFIAAANGHLNVVQLLLEKTGNQMVNKPNKNGETPLFVAVANGRIDIVKKLLEYDAQKSVNMANISYALTPLYVATANRNIDLVRILLKNGANESINKGNSKDVSPFNWASHNQYSDIINLFKEYGDQKVSF